MHFMRSAFAVVFAVIVMMAEVSPALGACVYTVTPIPAASNIFTANGSGPIADVPSAFDLTVSSPSCSWTVGSSIPAGCLLYVSPTSGTGNATITYFMAGNKGTNNIACAISVGGTTFHASLAGCAFALGASGTAVGLAAGSGTVTVHPSGWLCNWSATTSTPWITLTSGKTGSGDGTVGYSFSANSGAARSGTINIAGQTYTVTQAAAQAQAVTPADGLWIVDAEAGANGRGFQIELRNGMLVFTYYGYAASGSGLWTLSLGPISGNTFTAPMQTYQGGMPLGGAYAPSTEAANLGNVSITFTSATTGTISFPGEVPKAISKFDFSGSTSPSVVPANGLWIVDAEAGANGRGFQIEQHGGLLVLTYYGYLPGGSGLWTLSVAALNGSTFTSTMDTYGDGTALGGAYAAATATGSLGTVSINFTSPTTGTITFPGEPAKTISKFIW